MPKRERVGGKGGHSHPDPKRTKGDNILSAEKQRENARLFRDQLKREKEERERLAREEKEREKVENGNERVKIEREERDNNAIRGGRARNHPQRTPATPITPASPLPSTHSKSTPLKGPFGSGLTNRHSNQSRPTSPVPARGIQVPQVRAPPVPTNSLPREPAKPEEPRRLPFGQIYNNNNYSNNNNNNNDNNNNNNSSNNNNNNDNYGRGMQAEFNPPMLERLQSSLFREPSLSDNIVYSTAMKLWAFFTDLTGKDLTDLLIGLALVSLISYGLGHLIPSVSAALPVTIIGLVSASYLSRLDNSRKRQADAHALNFLLWLNRNYDLSDGEQVEVNHMVDEFLDGIGCTSSSGRGYVRALWPLIESVMASKDPTMKKRTVIEGKKSTEYYFMDTGLVREEEEEDSEEDAEGIDEEESDRQRLNSLNRYKNHKEGQAGPSGSHSFSASSVRSNASAEAYPAQDETWLIFALVSVTAILLFGNFLYVYLYDPSTKFAVDLNLLAVHALQAAAWVEESFWIIIDGLARVGDSFWTILVNVSSSSNSSRTTASFSKSRQTFSSGLHDLYSKLLSTTFFSLVTIFVLLVAYLVYQIWAEYRKNDEKQKERLELTAESAKRYLINIAKQSTRSTGSPIGTRSFNTRTDIFMDDFIDSVVETREIEYYTVSQKTLYQRKEIKDSWDKIEKILLTDSRISKTCPRISATDGSQHYHYVVQISGIVIPNLFVSSISPSEDFPRGTTSRFGEQKNQSNKSWGWNFFGRFLSSSSADSAKQLARTGTRY